MGLYYRPDTIEEALDALSERRLEILAGGTDYYPARVGRPLDGDVLDITAIGDLRGIDRTPDGWRIGATTTWTDIIEADLPAAFDGLKQAAREVGGVQIQNAGTLAGNLCNASPAADGVPPLLTLDADVELASAGAVRTLPLRDFIRGNRETERRFDELVTAIHLPASSDGAMSSFLKLGARKYLVISIVMAAVVLEREADTVTDARVAVGSCSAVAQRLPALEKALLGTPWGAAGGIVTGDHLSAAISPITDVRATAAYRDEAAVAIVRRALDMATDGPAAEVEAAA